MTLEEMREMESELNELSRSGVTYPEHIEATCVLGLLRDAIRWREMMTERRYSELVHGETYFVRNLLIGGWSAMSYSGHCKDIVDYCKDTLLFLGPIPMPEVTQ